MDSWRKVRIVFLTLVPFAILAGTAAFIDQELPELDAAAPWLSWALTILAWPVAMGGLAYTIWTAPSPPGP